MGTAQTALTVDDATLPVIDLSALFGDDVAGKAAVSAALDAAARTSGFFYITGHGIDPALMAAMFRASRQFHEMPRPWKMRYWCGHSTNHRGYVPFEENGVRFPEVINFNEAWDMSFEAPADHPLAMQGWRMTGPNVWPDIPGWRETVSAYYDAIFGLGLKMMDALAGALGVDPAALRAEVTCPTSQLRMLRYLPNAMEATEERTGISSHSDFECFTILLQGGPGLQVMNAEDIWIEAPPIEGAFIVNIGDIFEAWSGGRYKSTQHRVVNTGRERYSFPLFFGLDYDAVVQPLEPFRTEATLAKYPPFKAGDHLMSMTCHAFRYVMEAKRAGWFTLDIEVPDENPFKREAKAPPAAAR
ncbi:MAG: 2-oxoglutarate and iron-dependent oxygenase domain-containing protein [Pseudomonadota bacterium]